MLITLSALFGGRALQTKHFFLLISVLFMAAFYVRHKDLATHFSTYDDLTPAQILLKVKKSEEGKPLRKLLEPSLYLGANTSYAPLQFFLTNQLLDESMGYRETLYWGRIPSFLFSFLTIILFFWLLVKYYDEVRVLHKPLYQALLILGTVMFAFSWEHVIYTKFMGSYTIGPFFLVLFLLQLFQMAKRESYPWTYLLFPLFLIMLGGISQYQLILFVPGFAVATAWLMYRPLYANHERVRASLTLLVFGFSYVSYFIFVWKKFLKPNGGSIAGERGLEDMFLLGLENHDGFLTKAGRVIEFFPLNFGRLIGSNLSYTFESTPLSYLIWTFCFFFLLMGYFKLWSDSKDNVRRSFALFITVTGIVWMGLIFQGKMALSPTRHHMILIPLMILLVLEGVYLVVQALWLARISSTRAWAPSLFAVLIVVSFAMSFPKMTKDRQDPFDEKALIDVFQKYNVGLVYEAPNILNLYFMKDLGKQFPVVSAFWVGLTSTRSSYDIETVAFVAQMENLTPKHFSDFVQIFNKQSGSQKWIANLEDYEVIHSESKEGVPMDYSSLSQREKNNYRLHILKRKPDSSARLEPSYDKL